jgi:ubiquinone/menaquinone biosynthesis C-methylase UbiE
MLHHDTLTPDVETASPNYASRFTGPVGRFFLDVQRRHVMHLLGAPPGEGLRILEVGGGHAQLTPALLEAGHEVWVQGSAAACREPLEPLLEAHPDRLHFVAASLFDLPFDDGAFDAVVAVRLLAHVDRHEALLREMARVSRRTIVVDFPPLISANLLEPVLFHLKRRLEGNTRPFFSYRARDLQAPLRAAGFTRFKTSKQFFLPMVVHRKAEAPRLSSRLEEACRRLGLTRLLGAPALLAAERTLNPTAEV